MKTLPNFPEELKELETLIRSTLQPYIELKTTVATEPLSVFTSKFGGNPFWMTDIPYPTDEKGYPLFLLAQINFEEMPALEPFPTTGILQFFISAKDGYFGMEFTESFCDEPPLEQANYRIHYWEKSQLNQPHINDFSFVWKSWFDNKYERLEDIVWDELDPLIPIYPINAEFPLTGIIRKRIMNKYDFRFEYDMEQFGKEEWIMLLNLLKKYDLFNLLRKELYILTETPDYELINSDFAQEYSEIFSPYYYGENHVRFHLGGFAITGQGDPREERGIFTDYIVLLGVGSQYFSDSYDIRLTFGDDGDANFFIHPDKLKIKDFSQVFYSNDSG